MAGFSLDGVEGRIPCPHCGSTDCCGISSNARGEHLMCLRTGKRVTTKQLKEVAAKLALPTDYKFPNTGVDAGCIVIADPSHYEEWGSKHGPTHSVSVENGDYIAKWTIPDGWLEENRKPTAQPLKITSGSLWVSDPCYVVGDDKWMEYLEKYKYFKEMPEGVIAINTGGDGAFTVCLKLTPEASHLPSGN